MSLTVSLDLIQQVLAQQEEFHRCRNALSPSDAASLERAQLDRRKAASVSQIKQEQLNEKFEEEEKKKKHHNTDAYDNIDGDDEFRMGGEEITQEDGEFVFRTVRSADSSSSSASDINHDPSLPAATAKATRLLQSQFNLLTSLQSQFAASSATSLAAYFDSLYLPLFSVLLSHPRAAEKAANTAVPQSAVGLSLALLPGQDRVWELALRCLVRLLDASAHEPSLVRSVLVKRFFGIFQLIMHFLPAESKAADSTSQQSGKVQSPSTQKSLTVYHSEETRLAAYECIHALFLCVEEQLAAVSKASTMPQELQSLLSMFQSNPAFSLSLGYYLHLLLQSVGSEKNRSIRSCCVGGLDQIRRLLSHARMNVVVKPPSSQPTSPFDSVTGDALLLSYFPGMATALFNVLVYDSSKVKSGGWKLQMAAFQLFVDLVRHVVRYVAADDKIVQVILSEKSEADQKASMMADIADTTSEAQSSQSTDAAMAKLYALLPASTSPSDVQSAAKQRPVLQLSKLHPVLQSIMKPLDADWWRETRGNLSNLMQKIFAATQLTQRPEMAQSMLQAALEFLVGTKDDDLTFPNLTRYENSIYTTLMPSPSVLHWLEFVIYCTQHQDATIQAQANEAVAQIAAKTEKRSKQVTAVTNIPNTPSLVPLLTSSLSSHLIKLPRLLYTASESAQLTHLKTVHGYILLLGKQQVLFNFMESELEHILKILYRSFEVEATESKVLERESSSNQNSDTRLINPSNSTAIAIPTYYSFSISHLHSSAAQELSLSILRSIGFYLSTHFGLFIAHLHEQLIRGIQQVESGNYSASNQLKETVLFINQIILGVGTALRSPEFEHPLSISEIIPHIELLLFEYLNPSVWHLPLSTSKQTRNLSNADLQNNLLIVSLLVRGIGDMAAAMGGGFSSSLMHILYPLFEKLGSRHSIIHQAALVTLYRVAIACGYGEGVDTNSLSSAEPVLQAMIVANMDYLVEQMSVELRDLDFSAPQMASGNTNSSHPMTLPLVLSSLLTKISLSCAQAIIPLLDDVLQRILDKLCQVSWNATDEQEEYMGEDDPSIIFEDPSAGQMLSSHMSRLAYLEILRSIVAAIHRIQLSTSQDANTAPVSSLFSSTDALPLLQPPSQPLLKDELKSNEYAEVDAMLNLGDDEPAEAPTASKSASGFVPTSTIQDASSAVTSCLRARLQALIATRLETSVRTKKEEDWLKHTRAGGDSSSFSIEEESEAMEDVPRDAEGKTRAERWYEEREKVRAREEQKKFNSVNGIEDPEADEDLEREEKAHKDEPEIPLTKDQATALSIFQQCRNFLLPGTGPRALALQHATLCIAAEAIPVLERVPKSYFPEIAKFWPSLLQSLRLFDNATTVKTVQRVHESLRGAGFENSAVSSSLTNVTVDDSTDRHLSQLLSSLTTNATAVAATGADSFTHSTASPLFIQSLQVLALICRTASKFMAGRFATELWPLLQQILHQEKNWMKEIRIFQLSQKKQSDDKHSSADIDARLKLLPAYKIQKAVLDTLVGLARLPDLSSHHLLSLAQHAAPYLSSRQPVEFQERAILILQSLMQLDRDMVWFVLWKLTPEVAHKPINAVPIESSTFLSHPCFLQSFQNFNAHLLLNHRATSQTFEAEFNDPYEINVRTLLENLRSPSLPRPKLSLF